MHPTVKVAKELRLSKGISIRQLASMIGVSFSAVAKWERSVRDPSELHLVKLNNWMQAKKIPTTEEQLQSILANLREALLDIELSDDIPWIRWRIKKELARIPQCAFGVESTPVDELPSLDLATNSQGD